MNGIYLYRVCCTQSVQHAVRRCVGGVMRHLALPCLGRHAWARHERNRLGMLGRAVTQLVLLLVPAVMSDSNREWLCNLVIVGNM